MASSTLIPISLVARPSTGQSGGKCAFNCSAGLNRSVCLRFVTVFSASLLGFSLLNYKTVKLERPEIKEKSDATEGDQKVLNPQDELFGNASRTREAEQRRQWKSPPAGKTLDLTFFALVKALDISFITAWAKYQAMHQSSPTVPVTVLSSESFAAPSIFAISSYIIMWSWFYSPHRLPRSYNTWISSAAGVDRRLIQVLRECREGTFIYGKDTGRATLLQPMCHELNLPPEWGDPAKVIPIPCTLYHSGTGNSCELHAISRFLRGWKFAMRMYLPLNLLVVLRQRPTYRSVIKAFIEASRSSAFLGTYISLFYYGVCFARTRVGPKIFSRQTVTPQMMDSGLCVGSGCIACGWSILVEKPARRLEIAFFVVPRALATMFPRQYDRRYLWKEQLVFATSVAIVLTTAQVQPGMVRGVFGRLLGRLLA